MKKNFGIKYVDIHVKAEGQLCLFQNAFWGDETGINPWRRWNPGKA